MIKLWLANLWLRTAPYLVALAALVLAGLGLLRYGWKHGQKQQADQDRAAEAQSLADAAQQSVEASRARAEVENENAKLPDAPAQKVADAVPGTAVGKLRDGGWTH